jgi:single-strand DNA-binding protein
MKESYRFIRMPGVNKVILIGHLGKEPELRQLSHNTAVVSFPLATDEMIKKGGKTIEQTEWHNIVMWNDLAEAAAKTLRQGKLIYVEGRITTRSFEDKSGIKRYTTEIIAESFMLLGRGDD